MRKAAESQAAESGAAAGAAAGVEQPAPWVLPSRSDPVARGATGAIGGPVGQHARLGASWWTPLRVLLALTLVTATFGWLAKAPCREHPWSEDYQYTRMCYTDVFALYYAEHLADGATPYLDHPVEYPVVIGGLMWGAAEAVADVPQDPTDPGDERAERFFDLTWLLMAGFALVVVATTVVLAGRRRPWDAALVALSPALLLHVVTNWDLAAVALAGLGLVLWARRRPAWAGVLLGLATATKLYPVLFVVPLLFLCLRAHRMRAWWQAVLALLGTVIAVVAPVYVAVPTFASAGEGGPRVMAPSAWSVLTAGGGLDIGGFLAALAPHRDGGINAVYRFIELNSLRPADWDSLWYVLQRAMGRPLDVGLGAGEAPALLNAGVAVAFLLCLTGLAVLVWRAPRRPRLTQVLFLALVAFLLTNKVFSPQYTLWLLPLAVLARPRWRAFLAWQAAEVLVLFTRFSFFVGNGSLSQGEAEGIGVGWFLAAVLVRDATLLVLAALVVRDVLRPERDLVRVGGVDDPAGGVLDGAGDPIPAGAGPRRGSSPPTAASRSEGRSIGAC